MVKRAFFIFSIVSLCFVLCSCETAKGLAKDTKNTIGNIGDAWQALKRADERFQEHFW